MSDEALTREGLIWKVAQAISRSQGKTIDPGAGQKTSAERDYILKLIYEASNAVDGKSGDFSYNEM